MENENSAGSSRRASAAQILGANVRRLRTARGWTQTELGDRLRAHGIELHQTTVAKLEGGSRPTTPEELLVLGTVLEATTYDDLLAPLPSRADASEHLRAARLEMELAKAEQRLAEQRVVSVRADLEEAEQRAQDATERAHSTARAYLALVGAGGR